MLKHCFDDSVCINIYYLFLYNVGWSSFDLNHVISLLKASHVYKEDIFQTTWSQPG